MIGDEEMLRRVCEYAASHSDDPRTHVAAALVQGSTCVYAANRLPRGIRIQPERLVPPEKYRWMEHAERGVIYQAALQGVPTAGCKIYCTWFSCIDCARGLICSGVKEIVGLSSIRSETPPRWEAEITQAERMFCEAGVSLRWLSGPIGATIRFDDRDLMV